MKLFEDGEEQETIRRISPVTKDVLMQVFGRLNVHAEARKWNDDGTKILETESTREEDHR